MFTETFLKIKRNIALKKFMSAVGEHDNTPQMVEQHEQTDNQKTFKQNLCLAKLVM